MPQKWCPALAVPRSDVLAEGSYWGTTVPSQLLDVRYDPVHVMTVHREPAPLHVLGAAHLLVALRHTRTQIILFVEEPFAVSLRIVRLRYQTRVLGFGMLAFSILRLDELGETLNLGVGTIAFLAGVAFYASLLSLDLILVPFNSLINELLRVIESFFVGLNAKVRNISLEGKW